MSDKDLSQYIRQIREGDAEKGFTSLFEATRDRAYYIASGIVGESNAADMIQESYIKAFQAIQRGQFDSDKEFAPYFHKILRTTCMDYFRKNRDILAEDMEEVEDDSDLIPAVWLESKEKREKVQEIVMALPAIQRAVVMLYYFEEIPVAEIAEQLELSEGTVKSRLSRARVKIREAVLREEQKGYKLYSAGLPVLALILKQEAEAAVMPAEMASSVLQGTLSGLASSGGVAGAILSKFAAMSAGTKAIVISAVGVAVIGGGLGIVHAVNSQPEPVEAVAAVEELAESTEDMAPMLAVSVEPEPSSEPEQEDEADTEPEQEEAETGTEAEQEPDTVEESAEVVAAESQADSGADEAVSGSIGSAWGNVNEATKDNPGWTGNGTQGSITGYYREGYTLDDGSFHYYENGGIREGAPSYFDSSSSGGSQSSGGSSSGGTPSAWDNVQHYDKETGQGVDTGASVQGDITGYYKEGYLLEDGTFVRWPEGTWINPNWSSYYD